MEPMLRFKADDGANFPDWVEKTLGDEGKFYGGLSGKTKEDFETGDAHFVTYMNVYKNAFASQDMMGCVNVGAGEKQNRVLYGDLLFTQSSETVEEVGLSSVYLHDDEPYLNSFCMGYRFNSLEDVSPEFIGYRMRSGGVRKSIMLMGQGISRINLGAKRLGTVSYRLPSLPEQRKIADLLSAVDAVIAAQQAEVDAWEQRKKGVMQKLFSQEVRFKADDGSEFPDWEEKTLGEEGQFYGGLSGKGKDDFDCGNGRFVTYMNVYKNAFASRDAMGRVKVGDAEKQNKVRYGDILFTQSSETVDEVGLSSVYLYNDEPYLNSFCMGYRFNNLDNVCPEFIGYCMRSNEIRKSIMLMGQGISRINLGAKRLATVKYKIPSLSEQRKIADCLTSMDEVIQKSKGELAKWQELKKGLLQQMFV